MAWLAVSSGFLSNILRLLNKLFPGFHSLALGPVGRGLLGGTQALPSGIREIAFSRLEAGLARGRTPLLASPIG